MFLRQGFISLVIFLGIAGNVVVANDDSTSNDADNFSDLSQLSSDDLTGNVPLPPAMSKFSDNLRDLELPVPNTGKLANNKLEASRAMIGKFRINGI